MHGMLKRAAASAIPALIGLAVFPASAMAAPHTSQAVAGPVKGGRETHERLAQLPQPGTRQGRLAGTTSTAKITADTHRLDSTDAGFAATPAINGGGIPWLASFFRVPGSFIGGSANGIIVYGKDEKITGNWNVGSAGSGIDFSRGAPTSGGNATVSAPGNLR